MLRVLKERFFQGYRTMKYPRGSVPELPDRFQGRPGAAAMSGGLPGLCRRSPHWRDHGRRQARRRSRGWPMPVDRHGRCLFCGECASASHQNTFTRNWQLAAARRRFSNP